MVKHLTFFIAEKQNPFLETTAEKLREIDGMEVMYFSTIESALGRISDQPGYIIIEPEQINGIDSIPVFKQFLSNVKVFILTGDNDIKFFEEALEYGTDHYFLKNNCEPEEIYQIIKRYIETQHWSSRKLFSDYVRKKNSESRKKKIFHIDDNKHSTAVLERFFSNREKTLFRSFTSAIDFLHEYYKYKPDIVILDYYLEERITGMELLKIIKKENPSTEVIILSRQENAAIAIDLMRNGADYYMLKSGDSLKRLRSIIEEKTAGN